MSVLAIIGSLCGLGAWICSILVGVKGIQKKDTVLGVICCIPCCVIVGVIVGWIKMKDWALDKNLVLALTVLFILGIVLQAAGGGFSFNASTTP